VSDFNTLLLLPSADVTVGRNITHVRLLKENGFRVVVAAFSRGEKAQAYSDIDILLGHVSHGRIWSRIPVYKQVFDQLVQLIATKDLVIVYTLDNFLLAWMAKYAARSNAKIIFFLMDIRQRFIGDSLFNQIVQRFMIFAFERSELVLVTSRFYMEGYAAKYLKQLPPRWLEIENKVYEKDVGRYESDEFTSVENDTLVIGYFGVIRCKRSLEILSRLCLQMQGKLRVVLRGMFLHLDQGFIDEVVNQDHMEYLGDYRNPEDLRSVYESCDVVWGVYPFSANVAGNHLWAKTNRFYEASYFLKPLIVGKGTQDARFVKQHKTGYLVDMSDIDQAVEDLSHITLSDVRDRWNNLKALPRSEFTYTKEFSELNWTLREQHPFTS